MLTCVYAFQQLQHVLEVRRAQASRLQVKGAQHQGQQGLQAAQAQLLAGGRPCCCRPPQQASQVLQGAQLLGSFQQPGQALQVGLTCQVASHPQGAGVSLRSLKCANVQLWQLVA